MLGKRIKQFRLAKGWSQDDLVAELGGIISKNALSKYERDKMKPSLSVLAKIAKAFDAKIFHLQNSPQISTEIVAYRKGAGLGKKNEEIIENLLRSELEERIRLMEKLGLIEEINLPVLNSRVNSLEDCEKVAEELRNFWGLGDNPIADLTALLERNKIHVILKETVNKFDGISSLSKNEEGKIIAAAVVSRSNVLWSRQRLNLAHELGHLILKVSSKIDEEKAAFRFGAALLAPKKSIIEIIGNRRTTIQFGELLQFKMQFGISIQALIYRLGDLGIITPSYKTRLFQIISKNGWRKNEPGESEIEKPMWLSNTVMRAFSEKIISANEANKLLSKSGFKSERKSLVQKTEFIKLSSNKKNELLKTMADDAEEHYSTNSEWKEFLIGDFIEY